METEAPRTGLDENVRLKPIDTVWPAQLKVGINAINSSNEPFQVRFEELTFKGGKTPSGS